MQLYAYRCRILIQGGHSPGKPGKPGIVREFKSGQGKVREKRKNQGKIRENVFLHVVTYRTYCSSHKMCKKEVLY